MLNPLSWTTLTALSGVYLRLGAREMAARTLEQARQINPQDPAILLTLGEIYREEREYELARDAYRQALALEADLGPAAVGLGMVCSSLGFYAEAAEIFERLIKRGMRTLGPLSGLANLPASVVSIDVLSQLDSVVRDENKAEFENSAAFIRAAALDKAGRHAQAWEYLGPANRTHFLAKRVELTEETARQRASLEWLRENPVVTTDGSSRGGGQAISLFILGPSRSGKTTIEKLVATLNGVKRGYENRIVENAIRRAFQSAALITSELFENLPLSLYPQCCDIYLEELVRRAGSARVFTNTHPAHIYDAARIVRAFPNVRFIFVKRNLEDVTLRIYMRKYGGGNAYAYDLTTIRDHVVWYYQMIDLLAEQLSDNVRVINYEDMVADPSAALRTAAELCGLPMTKGPLPVVGDDRGCAAPYRQMMAAVLEG